MALLLTLFACIFPALLACQQKPYDVVIRNGHIVDGTGSPWYAGDIAIRDGRIAAVGPVLGAKAGKTIDAHGMVVAPGFIDMLGQSDLTILVRPDLPSKIFQGITTEFTGEGSSAAPLNARIIAADRLDYDHLKITPDWQTLGQYFARLERQKIGINVGDTSAPDGDRGRRSSADVEGAGADAPSGPGSDGRRSDGALNLPAVPAGALRQNRRADCSGQ